MKVRYLYPNPNIDLKEYSYELGVYLEKNKEYIVYGFYIDIQLGIQFGKIYYLLVNETDTPAFYAFDLFEIVDGQLPIADWHLATCDKSRLISFVLGYEEFAKSQSHFEGIILHDDALMPEFEKWKQCVDRQYYAPEDEWEKVNADVDGVAISFERHRRTGEYRNFKFVY